MQRESLLRLVALWAGEGLGRGADCPWCSDPCRVRAPRGEEGVVQCGVGLRDDYPLGGAGRGGQGESGAAGRGRANLSDKFVWRVRSPESESDRVCCVART